MASSRNLFNDNGAGGVPAQEARRTPDGARGVLPRRERGWTSLANGSGGEREAPSPTTGSSGISSGDVTEPRRVLIDWDYGAHGIWWVLTKEEKEAPAPPGHWSGTPRPDRDRQRPWSDRLSCALLDDLQAWNDAWEARDADAAMLQRRGKDLAGRVQEELGTDGWEVLYMLDGYVHRVRPAGSWPAASWQQELLGYAPRKRPDDES